VFVIAIELFLFILNYRMRLLGPEACAWCPNTYVTANADDTNVFVSSCAQIEAVKMNRLRILGFLDPFQMKKILFYGISFVRKFFP